MEPVLATKFGELLTNTRSPTFLNFVLLRSHPDLGLILADLERVLRLAGVRSYQLVINRGQYLKVYSSFIQVKLKHASDLDTLKRLHYNTLPFGKQWADAVDEEELEVTLDEPQYTPNSST